MEEPKKRGAFFDVDYTILDDNSVSLFVRRQMRDGKLGYWSLLMTTYYLVKYKLNLLDFEALADKETLKYKGEPESEMIELCDDWFEVDVKPHVYPEAAELINEHKAKGDVVVLLSAASIYLVRPLARHLGVDHWVCNAPEVDDRGYFTGKLLRPICFGEGKITCAEIFADKHGLDLSRSLYYSDSITDLQVLERFGVPMVVNPDRLLRMEARKRSWPVREFKEISRG